MNSLRRNPFRVKSGASPSGSSIRDVLRGKRWPALFVRPRKNGVRCRRSGVSMTKIPQGEWSAIAARYANGETITRIAQRYGCTPPAIHYILKRHKQRSNGFDLPRQSRTQETPFTDPPEPKPPREEAARLPRMPAPRGPSVAGLDDELLRRAEAAIAAFRLHYVLARTEGSAAARHDLRRAAADLMRVAARTTIVLDRAGAAIERAAAGRHDYPGSAYCADDPDFRRRVPR